MSEPEVLEEDAVSGQWNNDGCKHCWHHFSGPIWMVLKDGQIVQKCCKCDATRVVHQDHAHEQVKP
jgi:hypothetical protein